jgi:hypothetical protein
MQTQTVQEPFQVLSKPISSMMCNIFLIHCKLEIPQGNLASNAPLTEQKANEALNRAAVLREQKDWEQAFYEKAKVRSCFNSQSPKQ